MMEMAKKVEDWSAKEEPATGKGSKPNNGANLVSRRSPVMGVLAQISPSPFRLRQTLIRKGLERVRRLTGD